MSARERGLGIALELQRREDPKNWRKEVDAIEDLEVRAVADQYLRDVIARTKAAKAAKIAIEKKRDENRAPWNTGNTRSRWR